jgi:hypothetical protein
MLNAIICSFMFSLREEIYLAIKKNYIIFSFIVYVLIKDPITQSQKSIPKPLVPLYIITPTYPRELQVIHATQNQ